MTRLAHSILRYPCLLVICLVSCPHLVWGQSETVDDVLQHVPMAAVIGMKASGVQGQSATWTDLIVSAGGSYLIATGMTWLLKHLVHKERPDGSDHYSFPSGHATYAFAGATILRHEYGHLSPWITVSGYSLAALVSVDRVRRDRHHWMDVIAGGGIGVLSGELGYWLGNKLTGKKRQCQLLMSPQNIYFCYTF